MPGAAWGQSFVASEESSFGLAGIQFDVSASNVDLYLFNREYLGSVAELGSSSEGFLAAGVRLPVVFDTSGSTVFEFEMVPGFDYFDMSAMEQNYYGNIWSFDSAAIQLEAGEKYWIYAITGADSPSIMALHLPDDLYSGGDLYRTDEFGRLVIDPNSDAMFSLFSSISLTATSIPEPSAYASVMGAISFVVIASRRRERRY
jgi:hypothetical protein